MVFQWAPTPAKLCTCYSSCGNFGPDPACPDCVGGEVLCDTCFSQGSKEFSISIIMREEAVLLIGWLVSGQDVAQ